MPKDAVIVGYGYHEDALGVGRPFAHALTRNGIGHREPTIGRVMCRSASPTWQIGAHSLRCYVLGLCAPNGRYGVTRGEQTSARSAALRPVDIRRRGLSGHELDLDKHDLAIGQDLYALRRIVVGVVMIERRSVVVRSVVVVAGSVVVGRVWWPLAAFLPPIPCTRRGRLR